MRPRGLCYTCTLTSFCVYADVALRGFHLFGPCQRYSVSNQTSLSNGERPHYVLPEALSPKQHTHVLRRTVYLQISLTIQNRLLNPFFNSILSLSYFSSTLVLYTPYGASRQIPLFGVPRGCLVTKPGLSGLFLHRRRLLPGPQGRDVSLAVCDTLRMVVATFAAS